MLAQWGHTVLFTFLKAVGFCDESDLRLRLRCQEYTATPGTRANHQTRFNHSLHCDIVYLEG